MAYSHSRQGRDGPNYRTLTHRGPFLTLLFLLICGLLTALEWMLRVIPSATERRSVPSEFHPLVPIEGDEKEPTTTPYFAYENSYQTPTQPLPTSYELPTTIRDSQAARLITKFERVTPQETPTPNGEILGRLAPEPAPDPNPRLSSDLYASIGMTMRTHFTWADYWIPDPGHRGNRIPLSEEEATKGDHCAFFYKGVATTQNESACAGVITFELRPRDHDGEEYDRYPGPVRFDDPKCTRDYVQWLMDFSFCQTFSPSCSFFTIRNCWKLSWTAKGVQPLNPNAPKVIWAEATDEERFSLLFPNHEELAFYYYDHIRVSMWQEANGIRSPYFYEILSNGGYPPKPKVTPRRYDEQTLQFYQEWRDRASQTLSYHGVVYRPIRENEYLRTFLDDTQPVSTMQVTATDDMTKSSSAGISSTSISSTGISSFSKVVGTTSTESVPAETSSTRTRTRPSHVPSPSSVIPIAFTRTLSATQHIPTGSITRTRVWSWTDKAGIHTGTIYEALPGVTTKSITSTATVVALVPIAWKTASAKTTLTNSKGEPTSTEIDYGGDPIVGPAPLVTSILSVWKDPHGQPHTSTETLTLLTPISSRVSTLVNSAGVPTATVTEYPVLPSGIPSGDGSTMLHLASSDEYFAIFFLPIILSALISVPIQMLDAEIRVQVPFRSLTLARFPPPLGADSLCVRTRGWGARGDAVRLLWRYGEWVPVASYLLVVASTALVALASETVGVKLRGSCTKTDAQGCFLTVATFTGPAKTVEALLATMLVLIALIGASLSRWRSGVATHPASVAAVCTLLQNPGTVKLLQSVRLDDCPDVDTDNRKECRRKRGGHGQLVEQLGDKRFALAWDPQAPRGDGYGLVVVDTADSKGDVEMVQVVAELRDAELPLRPNAAFLRQDCKCTMNKDDDCTSSRHSTHDNPTASETASTAELIRLPTTPATPTADMQHRFKFQAKTQNRKKISPLDVAFLFIHLSLLTIILYYEMTVYGDPSESPFEAFMDSQDFGVRLLFSSLGTLIAFFWESLFADIATEEPYRLMAAGPVGADVLLHAQPSSPLEGLWQSVRPVTTTRWTKTARKKRNKFHLASVALASVLNKLLAPVLLSNIPFQISQTWTTHEICVWLSVVVLGYSTLVLVWHLFREVLICRRRPPLNLPVHPQTLAGRMYYVCDSAVLADFARLSMLSARPRDERVSRSGHLYKFGPMVGVSGQRRVGIDFAPGPLGLLGSSFDRGGKYQG